MTVVTCKSTRYGPGCGHPVGNHDGTGECCCCNWRDNDPSHVEGCERCKPILDAYLARQQVKAQAIHDRDCAHALGLCRYGSLGSDRSPEVTP